MLARRKLEVLKWRFSSCSNGGSLETDAVSAVFETSTVSLRRVAVVRSHAGAGVLKAFSGG